MSKHPLWVTLLALSCVSLGATSLRADPLAEVARKIDAQARRASSGLFDPESNIDAYHIGAGQTQTLAELKGPGEIRHFWFTLFSRDRRYPRTAVLRIYWDDSETPSVETPFGDFFCAGNGMKANVTSTPVECTSYGRALNCYWRMPFRTKARIEVANEGPYDLGIYWQIDWMEFPKAPEDMMYFHARYRQECPQKTFAPYVIFQGTGQGHYVGTVFSLQCSYGSWFGESDDRFYIDGEAEPSIVGTGNEDYFNDAWNLRLYSNPNLGVTIKEPNAEDCRFTAYRWHIPAPVTFKKSLKVEIERRSFVQDIDPQTGRSTQYDFKYRPDFCSSVAYWYQSDIARRTEPFPPVNERVNKEIFLELTDMADQNQIRCAPGTKAIHRSNRVCNMKEATFIENQGPGGWFEVPCRVTEEGRYSISIYQCLKKTNGIWKVALKGPDTDIVLAKALDFYDPYLAWKENRPENFLYGTWMEEKVGLHRLKPGDYTFRFECVGANILSRAKDSDKPGYDCILDGISLRRFPWDDLHKLMQDYMTEENQLWAGKMDEATKTVADLAAAIERRHTETGRYPAELGDLATKRDPWGQLYRYVCPGLFNPHSFDVYSVHGNSRDASVWIGNWTTPYRWADAIEAEDLKVKASAPNIKVITQELRLHAPPPLSGGKVRFARLPAAGDWIELALPDSVKAGTKHLVVRLAASWDYGVLQISLNGKLLGKPIDAFAPKIVSKTVDLGDVELLPSGNVLRIEAVDHNPASKGFAAGIDAIRLAAPTAKTN